MISNSTEDFEVTWTNPADAEATWLFDTSHFPKPVPPLARASVEGIMGPTGPIFVFVNGYRYARAGSMPPPTPEMIERGARAVWLEDFLPRLQAVAKELQTTDYDAMTLPALGELMPRLDAQVGDAFMLSVSVGLGFMAPTFDLVAFCERELGEDGGRLAGSLLQGYENATQQGGARLAGLARFAAERPEVAARLAEGRYDDIEGADGGAEFMARFRAFLDEYGWRAETFSADMPTWAEEPEQALAMIRRYAANPALSPDIAIARSIEQREAAAREVESRLSSDKLAAFEALLAAAREHVPISEGRAHWQLTLLGSIRRPALVLGRKLVEAGSIDAPADVFFLSETHVVEAAASGGAPFRDAVAKSKADMARWSKLQPPPTLGAPLPAPPAGGTSPYASFGRLFLGGGPAEVEDNVIHGRAASAGVVRGTARLVIDLRDADRLQPGDILVCRMTAPPWTPLFSIAAGVVTDSGGVLSHSAICAREYGIPCIVGTQVGTRKVPDGALIELDGTKGTVTIL